MSEQLKDFLVSKICQSEESTHYFRTVTHCGKCKIIGNDLDIFYNLCNQHLTHQTFHIEIIERQTYVGKLFIDIDFKSSPFTYTHEDIVVILNEYKHELSNLLISNDKMDAFVLEKIQALNGIHIIYPKIKLTKPEIMELHIRVKNNLIASGNNTMANNIDHTTLSLYMCGFGKPNKPRYTLTKIFSHDLTFVDANSFILQKINILKSLSIRT